MSIEVTVSSQPANQRSEKQEKISKEEKRARKEQRKRRHEEIEEPFSKSTSKKTKTSRHEAETHAKKSKSKPEPEVPSKKPKSRPEPEVSSKKPKSTKPKHAHHELLPETSAKKPSSKNLKASYREPEPEPEPEPEQASLDSPFVIETRSFYLPLPPIATLHPLPGLCAEHLAPLILTYHRKMKGVVLAYDRPALGDGGLSDRAVARAEAYATCINEYAAAYSWVTANFLVFRPTPGMWIEGYVTVQTEGHLGLLCLNLFNASIIKGRMPPRWKWKGSAVPASAGRRANGRGRSQGHGDHEDADENQADAHGATEDEGYWEDSRGKRVEGALRFRVMDLIVSRPGDRDKGFFGIEGSLLTEQQEEEQKKAEQEERDPDFTGIA